MVRFFFFWGGGLGGGFGDVLGGFLFSLFFNFIFLWGFWLCLFLFWWLLGPEEDFGHWCCHRKS